ncbi:MAG: glycosyltransferase family 2 protein [Patescibacteria group bacterium]
MPLISIVTITNNRRKYIAEAIESALSQSFADWELIIIDDASFDNTAEAVAKYTAQDKRIKFIRENINLGITKARNLALRLAQGKYITVLDSDDIWADSNKLQKQYEFLEKNDDYVVVGGAVIVINENGKEVRRYKNPTTDTAIRAGILLRNPFLHSSVMFRRDAAVGCGGYGEYTVGEDYDLFLKMGWLGKLANTDDYLVKYRKHDFGITWAKRVRAAKDHLSIIIKYKKQYPNYFFALIKGYLRLALSWALSL